MLHQGNTILSKNGLIRTEIFIFLFLFLFFFFFFFFLIGLGSNATDPLIEGFQFLHLG